MLQGDFYTTSDIVIEGNALKAVLRLHVDHNIFTGHFPGQPVVPGVCMMQMVKDMLELQLQKQLSLLIAQQMKFLNVINPLTHVSVNISVTYSLNTDGNLMADAQIFMDTIVFFKFKGLFKFL